MTRVVALLLFVSGAACLAASQNAALRAPANTVWITATVTDSGGRLVPNLTQADFRVVDNGTPGVITTFQNQVLPFALVVLLDVSGSMSQNVPFMREAATQMIGSLNHGDRVLFGSLGTSASLRRGTKIAATFDTRFAANRVILEAGLDAALHGTSVRPCFVDPDLPGGRPATVGGGASPIWDGVICGVNEAFRDSEAPRRAVVVITDGRDNASHESIDRASNVAGEDGILIYAIGMFGDGLAVEDLRQLANETGGGFIELADPAHFTAALTRVIEELHHQYVFGYVPPARQVGKHKIEVKVNRSGLTVRARQSYLAPPGGTPHP